MTRFIIITHLLKREATVKGLSKMRMRYIKHSPVQQNS